MAERMRGKRWLVGAVVSLIVLGGAVSAGSAMGKKDSTPNAGDASSGGALDKHSTTVYGLTVEDSTGKVTGAFEIKDFSFGVENPTTIGSATGGAGAGKIKFNEFQIKRTTDKASPAFFKNCAVGAHYQSVTLEVRKVNDKNASDVRVLTMFTFGTGFTTKIDWSGPGDEGPEESITFVYGQLKVEYVGTDPADANAFAWDAISNREQ